MSIQEKLGSKFYSKNRNLSGVFKVAGDLCSRGVQINGAVFSSSVYLHEHAKYLRTDSARVRRFKLIGSSPYLLEVRIPSSKVKLSDTQSAKAFVWEDRKQSVVYLLSCQQRDIFDYLSNKMHSYLLPELSRIFLKTREMQTTLNSLSNNSKNLKVRIREYTSRSLIDDPNSNKRVRTTREWTDEDYASVFEKISGKRRWISSITMDLSGAGAASGKIRRNSTFSCTHGFSFFFNTVVRSLTEAVVKSRKFFENRDRLSSPDGISRPLSIYYRSDIFADKSQNVRLIECLKKLRNSALSVFHPNPYLHACLVDYNDGSSYDVWVTDNSSILLIPKLKSTTESIGRVCNHICDEFEEGEVKDFGK